MAVASAEAPRELLLLGRISSRLLPGALSGTVTTGTGHHAGDAGKVKRLPFALERVTRTRQLAIRAVSSRPVACG